MRDSRVYWIALNQIPGIGAVRFQNLLDYFEGDLERAWNADLLELQAAGLSGRVTDNLINARNRLNLDGLWKRVENSGCTVLTWNDTNYPRRLRQISQPPPVIYCAGDYLEEDELAVAIVGTRRVTAYGKAVTEELASALARQRVTVVSGLARGVDAVAHQAALSAGGRTIAVLGSGVDNIYPPEHRNLAERITHSGALISDYALGTAPESSNFPPRNRIISGLSMVIVVIEAGETSGALITASFAADQGRDVLAVPGNITSPNSKGTNKLIRDGARPYLSVDDVIEALNLETVDAKKLARKTLPMDDQERKIIDVIKANPMTIDEIAIQADLPVQSVSASLSMMELKGYVRNTGPMTYEQVFEERGGYDGE